MAVKRVAAPFCAVDSSADPQSSSPTPTSCKRRRIVWCPDDYKETGVLGKGGFDLVVKARHRAAGEIVAVKGLHSDNAKKPAATAVRGMLREVAFLTACRGHLFLVDLRELSCDPVTGDLSLVMEDIGPTSTTSSTSTAAAGRSQRLR